MKQALRRSVNVLVVVGLLFAGHEWVALRLAAHDPLAEVIAESMSVVFLGVALAGLRAVLFVLAPGWILYALVDSAWAWIASNQRGQIRPG